MRTIFAPLAILAFSACSDRNIEAKDRVSACWQDSSFVDGHTKLDNVDFIYLRGATVVIPSLRCGHLRLQAISVAPEAQKVLDKIEYRRFRSPLAARGTVIFDMLEQKSADVMEISIIQITSRNWLSDRDSAQLLSRMRAR